MRLLIITFFLSFVTNLLSQELVDQFGYGSNFCSGTYYLYSDSSFYYERGCEQRSNLTIGKYEVRDDTLILVPFRLSEVNIIKEIEFKKIDSSSIVVAQYKSIEDSVVGAYAKFVSIQDGTRWLAGELQSDSLHDDQNIEIDSISYFPKRKQNLSIAVCPVELIKLLDKRISYELKPDFNEVTIHLNLPFEILRQMILYEMKYTDLEPTVMTNFEKIIKIEYH